MELSALGRTPIPGPSPAGTDVRYEASYMALIEEIEKLSSVTQASEVSWKKVCELGTGILENQSKDMVAAAYTAVALMQTLDLEGLSIGLGLLSDLLETFWETGFPPKKRMRGRINALSWWQEKTLAWLKTCQPAPLEVLQHQNLLDQARKLDQLFGEKLPDLPAMREMLQRLASLPVQVPPKEPAPSETLPVPASPETAVLPLESPPAQPSETGTSSPAPKKPSPPLAGAVSPESAPAKSEAAPEDLQASRRALMEAALTFASFARRENPEDPWAFKATRMAAWLRVQSPPPSENGETAIPEPETVIKTALQTLLKDGHYREVVKRAEDYVTAAIFWLDLQRLCAQGLEGLGESGKAALKVLQGELLLLLQRLPGLEQLSFAGGLPFADGETRDWIATLQAAPASGAETEDPLQTVLEEARSAHAKKEEARALNLLDTAMGQTAKASDRIRLRLAQVELLCRSARFAHAAVLAENLLSESEALSLESWDPILAERLLAGCHQAFTGLGDEAGLNRAKALAARICRLRPAAALNLGL